MAISACVAVIFFSCDSRKVYEDKKDFPARYWVFNDPATFQFDIYDTESQYNLVLNVRNTAEYKYQNIYIQYYLEDSTGRLLERELKNIQLFHPVTGVPIGKGIGGFYNVTRNFVENYSFPQPGRYSIRFDQFMRQDSLADVVSVGIQVEKSK